MILDEIFFSFFCFVFNSVEKFIDWKKNREKSNKEKTFHFPFKFNSIKPFSFSYTKNHSNSNRHRTSILKGKALPLATAHCEWK